MPTTPTYAPGTGYWSNTGWVQGGVPSQEYLNQAGVSAQDLGFSSGQVAASDAMSDPNSPYNTGYFEDGIPVRNYEQVAASYGLPYGRSGGGASLSPSQREQIAQDKLIAGTTPTPVFKLPQYNPTVYGTEGVDGMLAGEQAYTSEKEKEAARLAKQARDKQLEEVRKEGGSILSQLFGMKSNQQARQEAEISTGIIPAEYFADQKKRIAELDTLNQQYANTVAQRDASLAKEQDRIAPLSVINGRSAQISRQYAPELNRMSANINSKAAVMEALKGNFSEAQKYVQQAVDAFTADKKEKYDQYLLWREAEKDIFNLLDSDYQRAYLSSESAAKTAYENARKDKTQVLSLMIEYPQAGILATDTLEGAAEKARTSQANTTASELNLKTGGWLDILQDEINSGSTPEQAARVVAELSANLGINVTQKDINGWAVTARTLKKAPAGTISVGSDVTGAQAGTTVFDPRTGKSTVLPMGPLTPVYRDASGNLVPKTKIETTSGTAMTTPQTSYYVDKPLSEVNPLNTYTPEGAFFSNLFSL